MFNFDGSFIRENVSLAPLTTWKIGGAARYFCEVEAEVLPQVFAWAKERSIPFCVLGGGSNVLIPSEGIDGLVIKLSRTNAFYLQSENEIEVSSAMPLGKLVKIASENNITGFDFLAGIPGTVGGVVFMNAGTGGENKREIADIIKSAKAILPCGSEKIFMRAEMDFAHRASIFQQNGAIISSAVFDASQKEPKESIDEKIKQRLAERKLREPENKKNAGSVFKSVGSTPAAVFIDDAGLKGLRVGGAMVSFKHANWIENVGGATSSDVLNLIEQIKVRVREKYSVELETEVRLLTARI